MPPKYTLYYYKLHARGEPIRMLFHYARQSFEEVNWEVHEFATKWKHKMPFKQAPVLEVQLERGATWKIAQTTAILRYLADILGLEAETPELRATCDMFGEYISGDITPVSVQYFETFIGEIPVEERPRLYETTYLPTIPKVGETIERQLSNNGSGFLVRPKLTWVDFLLAAYVEMMKKGNADAFKNYPLLEKHHLMVYGLPQLSEYIKNRPKYEY